MARGLLRRGHRVVVAGRRAEALAESVEGHSDAAVVPTDVSRPDDVERLFDVTVARFGRVDVLINNAGMFGPEASVDELALEDWNDVMATNVTGSLLCAREAMRRMKTQSPPGGRIVNNGSLSAHRPRPRSAAYTISKHAISGLSRSLALDGRAYDVSCTQLDIGNAATDMTKVLAVEALQPDGSSRPEPTFDARHVAEALGYLVELPFDVSVPTLTLMANRMPFAGRG